MEFRPQVMTIIILGYLFAGVALGFGVFYSSEAALTIAAATGGTITTTIAGKLLNGEKP